MNRSNRILFLAAIAATPGIALLCGCTSSAAPKAPSVSQTVPLEAFRSARAGAVGSEEAAAIDTPPADVATVPGAPTNTNTNTGTDTNTTVRSPQAPDAPVLPIAAAPLEPGDVVVLDSLVGQINGRPVFADAFFAPIDAQLRTLRSQMSAFQFERTLQEQIAARLWNIVQSELFLAQAMSRLTPQMQQGLFAWLEEREQDIIAHRGAGSREQAIQQLQEESGQDLATALRDTRDIALIRMLIDQEIEPRIIVSWKDIERRYQQRRAEFNPPGRVHLARIYLDTQRDADKITMVRERLARGDDFQEVAEAAGMENRGDFLWYTLGRGGLADIQENLLPIYRERVATLEPGGTTEEFRQPLSAGGEWIVWIHVIEVQQPEGRSLYDPAVQLALREELEREQRTTEQQRYFDRLMAESVTEDIERMAQRLFQVANQRYSR